MTDKYEELTKLKELLDSGVLTKEEFDTAKKKLLEGDVRTSIPSDKTNSSSRRTWWFMGSSAIIASLIGSLCYYNCSEKSEYSYYESSDIDSVQVTAYEEDLDLTSGIEEGSEEDYEFNNPWKKEYFHNEYGEDMPEHPYIRTYISGSWALQIAYSNEMGFRFSLHDNDDELKHLYAPVSIIFRTAGNEEYFIEPNIVDNHCVYVNDPDNVRGIGNLLNGGSFDILLNYQMYNEPHHMVWNVEPRPGFFVKSVQRML